MHLFKKILLVILSLGLLYSCFIFALILSSCREKPSTTADTLVILGAQVKGDPAVPSTVLKERLDTACTYLKEHPQTVAIVCGGQGADEAATEASVMRNYLVDQGIAEERLTLEDKSTTTEENIANALTLGLKGRVAIVTSDFHVYRGKMVAKRLGLEKVTGLAAPSKSAAIFKTYLREVFSLGYHLIFD